MSDFCKSTQFKNFDLLVFKDNHIYQISPYLNYKISPILPPSDGVQIYSAGFKTKEAVEFMEYEMLSNKDIFDCYANVFEKIKCEEIGGTLSVYTISDKVNWVGSYCIDDVSENFVVGDIIVGKILAGNQLQITNSNNNFLLDANGCILNNASFTLTTSNNKGKIILDASQGIKIQGNTGAGFEDKFFVDTSGNVNFTGKLNGATGSFSGELTSATFKSGSININEKFKVDALGNCTATSINITGGNFSSGSITGTSISGGSLNIGNGNFTVNSYGSCVATDLEALDSIYLGTKNSNYTSITFTSKNGGNYKIGSDSAGLYTQGYLSVFGGMGVTGTAYFQNNIYMNGSDLVATRNWVDSQLPSRTASYSGGNHNHGIPDGTALAKAGGGSVTWRAYDGFSHRHDI